MSMATHLVWTSAGAKAAVLPSMAAQLIVNAESFMVGFVDCMPQASLLPKKPRERHHDR